MYCKYQYAASVSLTNMLSDVVKLLTGTTDITQLSGLSSYTTYSSITWTNGSNTGTGFSGLTANGLIGQYVHYNGSQIGVVTSNTDTTVTMDSNYSGATSTGDTYITSVFGIWTSWQNAGWTVHDASAGSYFQVLKQPVDSSLGSGNIYLGVTNSDSRYFWLRLFENWDNVGHTGTREANGGRNYSPQFYTTTGYLYISSSPWHCAIHSYSSYYGWGSGNANNPMGVFQRTRRSPWDTNSNAYPPAVVCQYTGSVANTPMHAVSWASRYCSTNGADVTGSSAALYLSSPFGSCTMGAYNPSTNTSPMSGGISVLVPNASKVCQHLFVPLWVVGNAGFLGGDLSGFSDFWSTTYNFGSALDEITQNGNTYVIWTAGAWRFAVRKG